ncbi:HNH endonuclease signature motif containing protein, partial [Cronobacter sakazakii]|uniref:HNH endonuclease signature motif containing protein n=1 Tax=Cronobacter sakazakii TaxID=28141 RepID=UPI0009770136
VQGKNLYNHRIVYFLHHGHWPVGEVDHIDGNPGNNHPDNLRDVTHSENQQNIPARGYYWHKPARRWQARIKVNGKLHSLGLYPTEAEARAAYLNAKAQLHPTAPARCYG